MNARRPEMDRRAASSAPSGGASAPHRPALRQQLPVAEAPRSGPPALRLQVLGELRAVSGTGSAITVPAGKQRLLLAALASRASRVVGRPELIDILWPAGLPEDPTNAVQHYAGRLRSLLGTRAIESSAQGYRLAFDPGEVDAFHFEGLVSRGQAALTSDPGAALWNLDAALALWRGEPYADAGGASFAVVERARLAALREMAQDARFDALLASGDASVVIPELLAAAEAAPLREALWVRLMLALYRGGRQAEALAAYQRARRHLADELGLDPGPELRAMEARILAHDPGLLANLARPRPALRANLPRPPGTSFVGRSDALSRLGGLIERVRLVTVRGPVGVGKSRLVMEWAAGQAGAAAPVVFVELESVRRGGLIASTVASAAGITEDPASDAVDRLIGQLRAISLTLVLDGCDAVREHVRGLVDQILARCPGVRVICTAVSPIGLRDEAQLVLRGLPAWRDDLCAAGEGARLFVERLRDHRAGLHLTASDLATVREIVEALDGVPFALELAAARAVTASLPEVLAGVVAGSDSLLGSLPGRPERHSSLEAALEWSASQLSSDHRRTLAELCLLDGPFTEQTAAAVVSVGRVPLPAHLHELVESALLRAEATPAGMTFRTAPSTRHLFRAGARSMAPALRRMVEHHAGVATQLDGALRGADQMSWLARADVEARNLRHAITIGLDVGGAAPIRIAASLGRYWDWRGLISQANDTYAQVLTDDGQLDGAADVPARVTARIWAAFFAWEGGDVARASQLTNEAVAMATADGTSTLMAAAIGARGLVGTLDDLARAAAELTRALDVAARAEDPWWSAWISTALSKCELLLGNDSHAAQLARRSLDTFRLVGDARAQGWALVARAEVLCTRQRYDDAREAVRDAVLLAHRVEDPRTVAAALEIDARSLWAMGFLERATEAAAGLEAMQLVRGAPLPQSQDPGHVRRLVDLEDRLGHAHFAEAWRRGSEADVRDLVRDA